ncbi:MAG: type III polyketide synthase [Chitinophagaceae bacterium]|nr:type III polyketide synthase [Chitinophagaceae bacterium]
MSKIVSIATAVPQYKHKQEDILTFMQNVYAMNEVDKRKLKFLYHQSAIDTRYSVLPDYGRSANDWEFYPATENLEPFPNLELRMKWFNDTAPALSVNAIENCITEKIDKSEITHLITVTCTGLSAPGLDLQIMEALDLSSNIFRTSVNFMGCYAAIHALKLADAFARENKDAKILVVCTELCTLHFQQKNSMDNIASSLLFGDGSAAVLVTHDDSPFDGLHIKNFYSEVSFKGKKDMSWGLSSSGFLMTLSGYIPDLIEEDFNTLTEHALENAKLEKEDISHWCIHPGGKKILTAIQKSIDLPAESLQHSYNILKDYGNMSSPSILFVLREISDELKNKKAKANIFGAAFGPGLTMETFILTND